jgi:hypothetical protein
VPVECAHKMREGAKERGALSNEWFLSPACILIRTRARVSNQNPVHADFLPGAPTVGPSVKFNLSLCSRSADETGKKLPAADEKAASRPGANGAGEALFV